MESYAIIIPKSKIVIFKKYDSKSFEIGYDQLKTLISSLDNPFDWFDAVRVTVGLKFCVMYCDDSGLCDDNWRDNINLLASYIYGDTIAGDVILLSDHFDGGSYTFSNGDAAIIKSWCKDNNVKFIEEVA